jgi:hypothetical protein
MLFHLREASRRLPILTKLLVALTLLLILNANSDAASRQSGHGGRGFAGHSYHNANYSSNHGSNYSSNHSSNYNSNRGYNNYNHNYQNNRYNQNGYVVGFPYEGFIDESDFTPYVQPAGPDDYDYSSEQAVSPPSQSWVAASNGQVPPGAVVNTNNPNSNGPTYYCQAVYDNQTFSGVLVPNDGCYVQDETNGATIRLTTYEVLVEMQ